MSEVAALLQSDYAAISPELLGRLHRAGYEFIEVPVPHYPRENGRQSGLSPHVVVRSFLELCHIRRTMSLSEDEATWPSPAPREDAPFPDASFQDVS